MTTPLTDEEALARFDHGECLHCARPFPEVVTGVESSLIWCARCQHAAKVRGAQQGRKPWQNRSVYRGLDAEAIGAYIARVLAFLSQGVAA